MHDQPGLEFLRFNLPQFLDSETVMLGVTTLIKFIPVNELPAQVTPAAFGKNRVACVEFHAGLKGILPFSGSGYAHVAGRHACDTSLGIDQDLRRRKTGIYFDLQRLSLLRQPAANVAQADYVVAPVVHARRDKRGGNPDRGFVACQEVHEVPVDRGIQRRSPLLPVRDQLIHSTRFQHSP